VPTLVVAHDFNGDGKLDLAVLNSNTGLGNGSVSVLLGNGDGTFQSARNYDVGGVNPTSMSVADFNADGKLDLAIGFSSTVNSCSGATVNILLGTGDGTFQAPQQEVRVSSYSDVVAAGDVNADGKADLVVQRTQFDPACTPVSGLSVFLGNGDGTFQLEKDLSGPPSDINGDGISDLIDTAGSLNIFLGEGNGRYKPFASGPESYVGHLTVGDLNNDQKQDKVLDVFVPTKCLLCTGGTTYVGVALGNGDGTFQPTELYPPVGYRSPWSGITEVGLGDFNGDGKQDVAFINSGSSLITILLGSGDGSVPTLTKFDPGSGENTFIIADLNGDGKPDIVTANLNDDTISVVLNTYPSNGADLAVQISATPEPVSITQTLTYTVTLQNLGPQDATNVVLTDNLPANLNFGSVTISRGSCTEAHLVVICNISKLVSGDTAIATIRAIPTATGMLTNSANATATETDSNTENNAAAHLAQVDPMFTLTVMSSGSGTGIVKAGNLINCGTVCTASFPTGTEISIQASPGPNSGFGGWGGACGPTNLAPACDLTMTSDQHVSAEFDPLPNFGFWLTYSTVTVKQGNTDMEGVGLYAEGASFPNPITLTCSIQGQSPAPGCTLSPNSVTLPDQNGVTSTLTISTIAPHTAALVTDSSWMGFIYALFLPLVGVALSGANLTSSRTRMLAFLFSALVCTALFSATSCGGGGSAQPRLIGGTPPGNYKITITGTSAAVQHSITLDLTVQ